MVIQSVVEILMSNKILIVDDDPNLLAAVQRQFRKLYAIETAMGPEGKVQKPYRSRDLLLSSYLPLPHARYGRYPVPLAEYASSAGQRANDAHRETRICKPLWMQSIEGSILHLLTKPCDSDTLANALAAGIRQYQLITVERELLEKTLRGSIRFSLKFWN